MLECGATNVIDWIVTSSVRLGRLTVAAAICVLGVGIFALRSAPVDVYPEFAPTSIQVQTEAVGLSAPEVESLISVPLEQDLMTGGIPWVDHIHSQSVPGRSTIDITFEPGTDLYAAREIINERLVQIPMLPNVPLPPLMIQPVASTNRVSMIGLKSPAVPLVELSTLARWKIRPRLMGIPGVANVAIWGQLDRQLQVQIDPKKMHRHKVSLSQVVETTGNALWVSPLSFLEASAPGAGGFIETPNQRLAIQHDFPITTPEGLASVPVTGASKLRLGDVANVVEDHQPLTGSAAVAGDRGLVMVIEKFPEADTAKVTADVEAAMASMAPGLSGVTIDTGLYRPATFIETGLHNVGLAGLLGLLAMIIVLAVFLYSWRAVLISVITIPLSMIAGAYVLYLSGSTFTTMTLVGIAAAAGAIIDDTVVGMQRMRRRLGSGTDLTAGPNADPAAGPNADPNADSSASPTLAQILGGAVKSVRGSLGYATVIMLLVTVPMLFIGNPSQQFSRELVLAFALAVLASTVVALTVTPALVAMLFAGNPTASRISPVARLIPAAFGWVARRGLISGRVALAALSVLIIAGLAIVPSAAAPSSMLPTLTDRSVQIELKAPPGTSLPAMNRMTDSVGSSLRALPAVAEASVLVGRAFTSDRGDDVNSAQGWVTLKPETDVAEGVAAIRSALATTPGLSSEVRNYQNDRVAAANTGTNSDLVVRVSGTDMTEMNNQAERVRAMLAATDGVATPKVDVGQTQPTIRMTVDLAAAQRHGVLPGDIRQAESALVNGATVGDLYEQQKVFQVVVTGAPADHSSIESLGRLPIDTPDGRQVPLNEVATLRTVQEPTALQRHGAARALDVRAVVSGRSAADVVDSVRAQLQGMSMPLGYHAEVLGDATTHESLLTRLVLLGVAVAVGVLLLLQAATGSWRQAALLLVVGPAACVGGALAALALGGVMSIGALAGLLAVYAVTMRQALVLVRGYTSTDRKPDQSQFERVVEVTRDHSGSIVLTVVATAALLAPAALMGTGAGLEILRPFAITTIVGFVTSLVVTLFVLPGMYSAFWRGRTPPPVDDHEMIEREPVSAAPSGQ